MTTPNKYIHELSKLLDPRTRDLEPTDGDMSCLELAVKKVDPDKRTITAIVSTNEVDRYQEIVEPKAYEKWLKHFMANPVMLAAHDHSAWSTGEPTVIGKWLSFEIKKDSVVATGQFMQDDELAERYWKRYRDGYMQAFSVGFIAHSWEMREFEVASGVTKRLRVFTEVELLEISAVAVPANRGALARAASFLAGQPAGDHDANQSAAIAKAIKETIDADIKQAIEDVFTDPDGPVARSIREHLERATDREELDGYFEQGAQPPSASSSEDDEDLKAALRELVDTAG